MKDVLFLAFNKAQYYLHKERGTLEMPRDLFEDAGVWCKESAEGRMKEARFDNLSVKLKTNSNDLSNQKPKNTSKQWVTLNHFHVIGMGVQLMCPEHSQCRKSKNETIKAKLWNHVSYETWRQGVKSTVSGAAMFNSLRFARTFVLSFVILMAASTPNLLYGSATRFSSSWI